MDVAVPDCHSTSGRKVVGFAACLWGHKRFFWPRQSNNELIGREGNHAFSQSCLRVCACCPCDILDVNRDGAQDVKHYRFAYDQPKTTGYGIAGDIFAERLKELSKGTMLIDQYPGAQLGQEPQVLQLVKAGDVEFCISSSANAATLTPQAGVMSLHFLFRDENHLVKALGDPKVTGAVKAMVEDTVQGAHVIAVITLGLRNMYSKKPIAKLEDIKGLKVRVQATPTEDLMFPYAQLVQSMSCF